MPGPNRLRAPRMGTTSLSHVVSGLTNGIMYTFTVSASNAVGTGPASAPSNSVLAALFTDHPLQQGTSVKAVHIVELRQRIDAQRIRFVLPAFSWTDSSITGGTTPIRAVHITDLRTALSQAYVAAGRTPLPTYSDSGLGIGLTVKLAHIAELRAALLAIE